MRNLVHVILLSSLTLLGVNGITSCQQETDCGCTPLPREPITAAALTQVNTWWLDEVSSAGQITRTGAIKDRYSMQFKSDGTYVQTLLTDDTRYAGTWMLMGNNNRTLHLTDHKGSNQEYTVEGAGTENLFYWRTDKTGQTESFSFTSTRK